MKTFPQKLSYVYLLAVPFFVTALAFIFGHLTHLVYLPGWILNVLLMLLAVRTLGGEKHEKILHFTRPIIMSWALISVFAGMGPPPPTAELWAALALEQHLRYGILIASGTMTTIGFVRLNHMHQSVLGQRIENAGKVMFLTALPLFVANMAYWGFFLTNVFVKYSQAGAPVKPSWLQTVSEVFMVVRMIEVTLIYLGTAAFAYSISESGRLTHYRFVIYLFFCVLGAILNMLPANMPEPLATANYVSYIPAITLLMPYLMAVNLLYISK